MNFKKEPRTKNQTHVVVLKGGISAEREVSLSTAEGVGQALQEEGFRVTSVDVTHDVRSLIAHLRRLKPHVIFNALHGRWGEDGCIQGLLELLKIPYTHSGVLSSSLAMNKPMARKIFQAAHLRCAPGVVTTPQKALDQEAMPLPFVIKPVDEGSSVGVHVVLTPQDLQKAYEQLDQFPSLVLVEKYIPGREIQVAVLGSTQQNNVRALGAIEIRTRRGFYDYEAKYTAGHADHLMPAPLSQEAYEEALDIAKRAHEALECRGVTRVDLRYDDTSESLQPGKGEFYVLEVNTQPGMTPLSLVPEIAAHEGLSFGALVTWLVENAECM